MRLAPDFLAAPITHRALHDRTARRPENSLAAIRAACEAGYGIEIDLQLSADNEAVVFHDHTLDRMTAETGPVRERKMAELEEITLMGGREKVPSLRETLDTVAGRVPLLIELKHQYGLVGPLEQAVARDLEAYKGPVAVMSFDPRLMATMARIAPGVSRGLTTTHYNADDVSHLDEATRSRLAAIEDFDPVGASFISHNHRDLNSPVVGSLKARGVMVLCWTIRSQKEEREARNIADNVTFEDYLSPVPYD